MSDSVVDLQALPLAYPGGTHLHESPAVWLFENFASEEELAALRAAAWEQLKPAEVSGDKDGYISAGRSGSNCWLAHNQSPLTLAVADRISRLVRIPLANAENFQVVHYGPGQEYRAHFDAWDGETERGKRCMERGGQRLVTTLLYL